jgi:hypothetical protein
MVGAKHPGDITKSCGLDEKKSISFGEIKNNQ